MEGAARRKRQATCQGTYEIYGYAFPMARKVLG